MNTSTLAIQSELPKIGTKTLIFAHRGAMAHAPQNTMSAFSLAWEHGADGIELDVQCTKDGIPVVFHDDNIENLTNGFGTIRQYLYEELATLDAGSHFSADFAFEKIPTLEEVLRARPENKFVNIELKTEIAFEKLLKKFFLPTNQKKPFSRDPSSAREQEAQRIVDATIEIINKVAQDDPSLPSYLLISSFDPSCLVLFSEQMSTIPLGFLYCSQVLHDTRPYMKTQRYEAFHPHYMETNTAQIRKAHKKGLRVQAWTVNKAKEALRLYKAGVDSIITNYPKQIREAIDSRK